MRSQKAPTALAASFPCFPLKTQSIRSLRSLYKTNISIFSRIIVFKILVFIISFRLNRNKIDKSIASFVFLIVIAFTSDRSSFFNLRKSKQIIVYEQSESESDVENQSENFNSFVFDMTFSLDII